MIEKPLHTNDGEFFLRSPRSLVQWAAEWLLIIGARSLYASYILYGKAGKPERATRIEAAIRAGALAEDKLDVNGDEDILEDPLYQRAVEIVVEAQNASVSLLHRRLRIGYTRAGRLIDMLEKRGVISAYNGSKPRRVLIARAHSDQA